ncbi:putative RNA-directed DNA polymerase from transposon X-element, partial [Nephila pilipes]
MINRNQQLRILSWNCNSIQHKFLEFQDFIKKIEQDIIALQETKLKPASTLHLPNFTTHRTDRTTHAGGGTALLVRNSLPHHATPLQTTKIEGTAVTLERRNKTSITIVSAYKSPLKPILRSELNNLFANRRDVLVLGDLNAKHHTWNPNGENTQGKRIFDYTISKNLKISAPTQPTKLSQYFKSSIIDICISKGVEGIQAESIPALSSDHNPVLFTVEIDDIQKSIANSIQFTNWNVFQTQLKQLVPGNPKIFTTQEVDQSIENFNNHYNNAIITASKTKIIHNQAYTLPPPLRRKIQLKNIIRKRWQETRDP